MLHIVQLEDGCYKVTVNHKLNGTKVHYEWTFKKTESEAKPSETGMQIHFVFENETEPE